MPGKLAALVRAKYPDAYQDMDDAALEAAVLKAHPEYGDLAREDTPMQAASPSPSSSSVGGMAVLSGLKGLKPIAENIATSPTLPRTAAKFGRMIGGAAPVIGETVGGGMVGGPGGAILGMGHGIANAAKGAWAGGRTGWFTGKLMQDMAAPVASGLEKIGPLAESLGPVPIYQQLGQFYKIMQDKEAQKATPPAPKPPALTNRPLSAPPMDDSLMSRLIKIGPET